MYEAARKRRREAYRPGTQRNLISSQRLFLQFCFIHNIPIKQPNVDDLGAYVEWLLADGLASATIKNHLSAIKNLYLHWDHHSVIKIFDSFSWSLTLRALKFAARTTFDNRTAITTPHLLALVRICASDPALSVKNSINFWLDWVFTYI